MAESRIPISLITGFLGAGKTTLLNHLLRHQGMRRTAVVINEFGEIGLDHDLIERASEDVIEMQGGCLCCTIRGDLSRAVRGLNLRRIRGQVPEFERLVIETTGLADPAPILQTLISDPVIEHDFRLEGVVTLVDGVNGPSTLDRHMEAVKQVAIADRLVVSKADLTEPAALLALEARLRRLNPAAAILRAVDGVVEPGTLFDSGPWDPAAKSPQVERWLAETAYGEAAPWHHGDHHDHDHSRDGDAREEVHHGHDPNRHDEQIRAFCIRRKEPIASSALSLFLDLLTAQRGADLLRVKAILNVAETPDRPLVIHAVQHVIHAPVELESWPSADRDSRLIFITRDIPQQSVEQLLDALATVEAMTPMAPSSRGQSHPAGLAQLKGELPQGNPPVSRNAGGTRRSRGGY